MFGEMQELTNGMFKRCKLVLEKVEKLCKVSVNDGLDVYGLW